MFSVVIVPNIYEASKGVAFKPCQANTKMKRFAKIDKVTLMKISLY